MNNRIARIYARPPCAVLLLLCLWLGGCASTPVPQTVSPDTPDDVPVAETTANPLAIYDPWEGFNRRVYRFNALADRYVLMPVVQTYRTVTPGFARTGVQNFFSNLGEINTFANSVLQAKPTSSVVTLSRFALNTTVGLAGLFDPASAIGLEQRNEDFGQTLGYYGVGAGPYLVLPFFGPSTLRDSIGLAGDQGLIFALDPLQLDDHPWARVPYWALYAINTRDSVSFRYYQTGSPFEYTLVRLVYMNYRALLIEE
ncbi:VacJ family lipoprotein [uncultured Salinisphaera sp.]|jgi:phospholipid-binding lipoprotein MlaA|uniref:MlaA family lipoprotein n=1 Tax=uncultured Salinisphaera sp. TaxID=359372 RepID=UPI0032B22890